MFFRQKSVSFFNAQQKQSIESAIAEAELLTSGEIRLFIDKHCKNSNPLEKAADIFQKLKLHKTKHRNGVLIYLAILDHQFAIIGDSAINHKVGADFWNETKELMLSYFKKDQICEGLIIGIKKTGQQLSIYFPRQNDDQNEITNKIAFKS